MVPTNENKGADENRGAQLILGEALTITQLR